MQMVLEAGAREVHLRLGSPPIRYPDNYGLPLPEDTELIANAMTIDEMARYLGCASVGFISLDGFYEACLRAPRDDANPQLADQVFTGEYPVRVIDEGAIIGYDLQTLGRPENPDIFISYSRQDKSKIARLVNRLSAFGWSVWWDVELKVGEKWEDAIELALKKARAVIVAWSSSSITSHWVKEEASFGRNAGRLVPLTLEQVEPPFGFRQFHCLDFSENDFDSDDKEVADLIRALRDLIG